ncbi:MAG: hypothetical protein WDZ51_14680 [Pirellulaceae bacterium]
MITASSIQVMMVFLGLVTIGCHLWLVGKMFQNGDIGWAIFGLVGIPICGLGYLSTFILGWINNSRYGVENVVVTYTIAMVMQFVLLGFLIGMDPESLRS